MLAYVVSEGRLFALNPSDWAICSSAWRSAGCQFWGQLTNGRPLC